MGHVTLWKAVFGSMLQSWSSVLGSSFVSVTCVKIEMDVKQAQTGIKSRAWNPAALNANYST